MELSDLAVRQYRLIELISYQLLGSCILIIFLAILKHLYYSGSVVATAGILVLLNLYLLKRSKNIVLCGHALVFILFVAVLLTNYLTRGVNPSFTAWLYVIPVVSLAIAGRSGLFIFSTLALLTIIAYRVFSIPPYYSLSANELKMIDLINHLFALVIIFSTLRSLMLEGKEYENLLINKNYSLQLENDKYRYLACFDELTGLPNRQYFKLNLETTITSLAPEQCITLFFMDLDNLKTINDSLGHHAGDYLLAETAKRLRFCFREHDFIARLGGDEFTAYIVHLKNETISDLIVKRIRQVFKQAFQYKNKVFLSTISIGLASCYDQNQNVDELIHFADEAMYEQKQKGGV